jgi:hypothetical protein
MLYKMALEKIQPKIGKPVKKRKNGKNRENLPKCSKLVRLNASSRFGTKRGNVGEGKWKINAKGIFPK